MWAPRLSGAATRLRAFTPAEWILVALVVAGVALRVVASFAVWPVSLTLADSMSYAALAETRLVGSGQHPGGYPIALHLLGWITREIAVTIVLQHVLGIVSALLLHAAVRRVTGSQWPGLVPAAVVLLNSDQIFLEHNVMAEALFVALFSGSLYAAVRAFDAPLPWWRWPLAAGVLAALAIPVRTVGLFFLPVLLLALLLSRPRPWRPNWRAPAAALGGAAVILAAFAIANRAVAGRTEISPATGWHVYGRVAPFADCNQFTPPAGTEALCTLDPPGVTYGGNWYIYWPESPALRTFGRLGVDDDKLMSWSLAVILHQPKTYLSTVIDDMSGYFVPSMRTPLSYGGVDQSPELDWTREVDASLSDSIERGVETFFDPFAIDRSDGAARFLQDYQRPFRFGATLLTICSLLTIVGLLVGPLRQRLGVLLFGVGGLAVLLLPSFGGWYTGRYAVPIAGTMAAAAAIAATSLWRYVAAWRAQGSRPAVGAPTAS